MQVADCTRADNAIADWPKDNHAIMQKCGQMHKDRYNGSLRKADTKTICASQIQKQSAQGRYKDSLCKGSLENCGWRRVF